MKFIYMTIGWISLGLGIVGVVLPVLPTVPFLLLTAFCFSKGSLTFAKRLAQTQFYQQYIETKSMTIQKNSQFYYL